MTLTATRIEVAPTGSAMGFGVTGVDVRLSGESAAAKTYTTTPSLAWIASGVDSATKDPYILHTYGALWLYLKAALAHPERGEVAIAVSAAKNLATKVGLDVTTRIFEVTGARSTATQYGCDRYWHDLRTFTLPDPVDYKWCDIGNWLLNHELPTVTQYS
jgi:alkylation response protein AidB-like acyl-CoA dehydrogenase